MPNEDNYRDAQLTRHLAREEQDYNWRKDNEEYFLNTFGVSVWEMSADDVRAKIQKEENARWEQICEDNYHCKIQ